jgi:hypothetical protein
LTPEQAPDPGGEAKLREKARQAMQAGMLPDRRPDRAWGGSGVGAACAICANPVKNDELEFEIEFARIGADRHVDTYHLHVRCFEAWQSERDPRFVKAVSSPSRGSEL